MEWIVFAKSDSVSFMLSKPIMRAGEKWWWQPITTHAA
jgi:hypothetical protein